MSDIRPTNQKIADLLQQQTYDERMELAAWFSDSLNDQKTDMGPEEGFMSSDIAGLFGAWAEGELEEEPTP